MKVKVNSADSTSKKNSTKLKTLETVHGTLKTEVDTMKTELKTIKQDHKTQADDNIKLQTQQQANSVSMKAISTRLSTFEDIIKRMNTIIDERVEVKVKELQSGETPIIPSNKCDDTQIEEVVKKINEKLLNEKDILSETINTKITETVSNVYSDNFPSVPIIKKHGSRW